MLIVTAAVLVDIEGKIPGEGGLPYESDGDARRLA